MTWTKRDILSGGLAAGGKVLMSQLLEPDQLPSLARKACKFKLPQMYLLYVFFQMCIC